ncbi:DUF6702 family protein [Flavobacterium selenitireducens]|uniref:DUF6702 family protein n=1 Tax=Flavobacterium selenitireducens TaxID=2722704 RepID=UPI00168BDE22|nr:DUF6702 family protein [Flavobacterium selenitireducens]MBD3583253.1 hypothetical protein [Flavobacterium selenitireducens]
MKKIGFALAFVVVLLLSSAWTHKFYVGIFQVNYASEKKMLQITTRIFVDDLNNALEKKHKKKFFIGEKNVAEADVASMKKYIADNFRVAVNGQPLALDFRSYEMENNVVICYFRITDVVSVKTLDITNKVLFDFVTEQQNIIQTNINGSKQNLLLTIDEPSGKLTF